MSDVQADINESQAVQAALTATNEAQTAVASIATPGNDPLAVQPVATAEPATQPAPVEPVIPVLNDVVQPGAVNPADEPEAKANNGAALAEQREAFKVPVDGQTLTAGVQVQTNHAPLVKAELPSTLGAVQAGNAMDTMHGNVNATWPPKVKGA